MPHCSAAIRLGWAAALVVALASCDTRAGSVPDLDDLREPYGALPTGRFAMYDAGADSTVAGTAVLGVETCGPPGVEIEEVCLQSNDWGEVTGVSISLGPAASDPNARPFAEAEVGDRFEIQASYTSLRADFASTSGEALVVGRSTDGAVRVVFWAVMQAPLPGAGRGRFVAEGGFSARLPAGP